MSDTYTKLFSSITASTIVSEPVSTRWAWVTMLAAVKPDGCVYGSVPGLARLANLSMEEIQTALACFLAPDPYSRTKDNEGRRIEAIDGGWRLLNHGKYDEKRNAIERAEYKREWDRKNRPSGHARQSDQQSDKSDTVRSKPDSPAASASASASASEEQEQKKEQAPLRGCRLPLDWQPHADDEAWAVQERPDVDLAAEIENFRDHWHSSTGQNATKVHWDRVWRKWIRNAYVRPKLRVVSHRYVPMAGEI